MSKVQKWLSVTAVTIFTLSQFLFLAPPQAFACSCMPSESVEAGVDMATAVFAGEVTQIDAPGGVIISSADPVQVTFQVSQVWKGAVQQTITITTPRESASCGHEFIEGQAYLVYANGSEDDLQVFLCSRTASLGDASSDLATLGAGTVPAVDSTTQPLSPGFVLVPFLVLLIAVVGGIWLVQRHRKRRSLK
ncbi:MAG: hypothetical protein HC804_03850 [Anaerolineae bacterium]|nr:hypothetical protein [Anaerolineae bacterium]